MGTVRGDELCLNHNERVEVITTLSQCEHWRKTAIVCNGKISKKPLSPWWAFGVGLGVGGFATGYLIK
jgi:hypothetical protein